MSPSEILTVLLASLGGSAFLWRVVDLYKDRVRVGATHIQYDEHHADGPAITMEFDNNGRNPLLLKREATLRAVSLGEQKRRRSHVRRLVQVPLRLVGDRRVEPIASQVLVWRLLGAESLQAGEPDFMRWLRVVVALSNRRGKIRIYLSQIDSGTVGPLRYWYGYWRFRLARQPVEQN